MRAFGRNTKGGKYRNSKKQFGDDFSTYMNKQNQQDKSQQLYENEEVFENLGQKERMAQYARFRRSQGRSDTPEEIKDMVKEFKGNKSRVGLTQLFKQWYVAKGDWKTTLVRV